MLIDAFLFSGLGAELMLLDLRLRELYERVDRFVLVQATQTFTGEPKGIYMGEQHPTAAKVRYVTVNDMPPKGDVPPQTPNAWAREAHQRNAILRGIQDAQDDDLVLLSDVDEIPRADSIPPRILPGQLLAFKQQFFYYDFHTRAKGAWLGTRICRAGDLRAWTPQEARNRANGQILNGGWHFSWMGDTPAIQQKIRAFSHQELNKPRFTDTAHIEQAREQGRDLFDRTEMQFEQVEGLSHLPKWVQEHPEWFSQFLGERVTA